MQVSAPSEMPDPIRVMLVDDSAAIRGALSRIIESDPGIRVVNSVSNGEQAITSAARSQPHVVILDVEMPVMDGLTALPKILEASPQSQVVMFSSLTEKGAATTIRALSLGAVECLGKPTAKQQVGEGSLFQKNLLEIIRSLAKPKVKSPAATQKGIAPAKKTFGLYDDRLSYRGKPALIAIGSSTGGPQALFEVIRNFKNFDMPIVVTQHMPATFTKILAEHVEKQTGIPAVEGEDGMTLEKGRVHIAPGGYHMHIVKKGNTPAIHIDNGPPENFCKPAVDPMFRTAIDVYGEKILGVILTGMGNDGLAGGRVLVQNRGRLIAQDEASSVVWGMPGAVAMAGICAQVLPLEKIGPWIRDTVLQKS
jgi:two-component system chemotaxis response regulator CheB